MLALTDSPFRIAKSVEIVTIPSTAGSIVVCAAEGPRPRYPRVWKTKRKVGTVAKSEKLVECNIGGGNENGIGNKLKIKQLSNVKEEVYGALDTFVAWELEFPLLAVKKALKTLESQQDWKRIIQVTKWMISKGQGTTMGSYFTLFNALAEDGRLNEVEELWTTLLMQNLRNLPHRFFDKMISIYHQRGMHEKMFEIFADMEELGVRPSILAVSIIGDVLKELGMLDKYELLQRKYPPPKWEYRYIKGKRVKIKVKRQDESNQDHEKIENCEDAEPNSNINKDDGSEKTSDINHEQFKHDANVVCKEPELISDHLYERIEPVSDV